MHSDRSPGCAMFESLSHKEMISSCTKERLDWMSGRISSQRGGQTLEQAAQGFFMQGWLPVILGSR